MKKALRIILLIFVGIYSCAWSTQGQQTKTAQVQGNCNSAVVGSEHTTVTITCSSISPREAAQFSRLLNKIIQNQIDPNRVYQQLDQLQKEVDNLDEENRPLSHVSPQLAALLIRGYSLFKQVDDFYYPWYNEVRGLGTVFVENTKKVQILDQINSRYAKAFVESEIRKKILDWRDQVFDVDQALRKESPPFKDPPTFGELVVWRNSIVKLDTELYKDKTGLRADFSDFSGTASQRDQFLK